MSSIQESIKRCATESVSNGTNGWTNGSSRLRGVLLINLGTPSGPDVASVRRYLAQFLSDPEVIRLPRGLGFLNKPLGHMIARFRAPKSVKMYEKVWTECGSPLGSITVEQSEKLSKVLPDGWRVFYAMRYGEPSIWSALKDVEEAGIEDLVVIPMYPQFSGSTTRTALRELYDCLKKGAHHIRVSTRSSWYDDGSYVYAQARLLADYACKNDLMPDNSFLVFSAHGLPVSYVEQGDPYPVHTKRTIELVIERLGWPEDRATTAYQSRFGPVEWLKPSTEDRLKELVEAGERRLLVCPISFTADCLETLEEIDVRYRSDVEASGSELYLCPALNASAPFISALKTLALHGPRPVISWNRSLPPLIPQRREARVADANQAKLVMIGVSVSNRMGTGDGPRLQHVSADALQNAKRPQSEVPEVLRRICEGAGFREAFLWNTCYRYELYGWTELAGSKESLDELIARVRTALFTGDDAESFAVNSLAGPCAWHHMMRTVAGLNSGLPGDRDVIEQFQTAHRLAQRAGTAGVLAERLVTQAVAMVQDLREKTEWGRFDPGYCYASLSRIVEVSNLSLPDCRSLVIGGSTTSRSVLSTLIERFGVPARAVTFAYRGHSGGQIKLLRKAIGSGNRLRVQDYNDRNVTKAIADSDVVIFGIDRDKPVVDAERIRDLRDYTVRPLTVIDFNTFGSTSGLDTIPGVTVWTAEQVDRAVREYADTMCASGPFTDAVGAAESWITEHVPLVPASRRNGSCDKGKTDLSCGTLRGVVRTLTEDCDRACLRQCGEREQVVVVAGGRDV